jgi:serine/threonine-protein kinase haspin
MDDPSHGVRATIIDLGLSRMDAGDNKGDIVTHWTPFEEETFMGEGNFNFNFTHACSSLTLRRRLSI